MSKLTIKNGGNWDSPSQVSVYNGSTSSWQNVEKVYIKNAGQWMEVWPNTININADFAIITINVDNARYPDLQWEVQSQYPDFMTDADQRGGRLIEVGSAVYDKHINPRPFFYPESNAQLYTSRLGRSEKNTLGWQTVFYGQRTGQTLCERMGVIADSATIAEMTAGYNQVLINYSALKAEFIASGATWDWSDPQSLGQLFRFTFFAQWPTNWSYNPASYPITFNIDLYQGGTIVRDPVTKVYSGSGYTNKVSVSQSFTAQKQAADKYYTNQFQQSPHNNCFYLDQNYSSNTASLGNYTPVSTPTIPRILEFRYTWQQASYLIPVCHILTPDLNPSIGTNPLDGPVYNTSGSVLRYSSTNGGSTGTEYPGSGDGMDVVQETVQYAGMFGSQGVGDGPYPYCQYRITNRWWLDGYVNPLTIGDINSGNFNYFIFDVWQYRWDNPTVDQVTFRLGAWWGVGKVQGTDYQSSLPITMNIYKWDDNVSAGFVKQYNCISPNFNQGNFVGTVGTVNKVVTAKSPDTVSTNLYSQPLYGDQIATVTVNYVNNTVTYTT